MSPEREAECRRQMAEIEEALAKARLSLERVRRQKPPGDINIALAGNTVWTLEQLLEDCRLSLAQSEAQKAGDAARELELIEAEQALWAGTDRGRRMEPLLEFNKAWLRRDRRGTAQAAAVLALEDPGAAAEVGLDPFAFVDPEGEDNG